MFGFQTARLKYIFFIAIEMSTCTINTTLKECNIVPWDLNLFIERDKTELYYVTVNYQIISRTDLNI